MKQGLNKGFLIVLMRNKVNESEVPRQRYNSKQTEYEDPGSA